MAQVVSKRLLLAIRKRRAKGRFVRIIAVDLTCHFVRRIDVLTAARTDAVGKNQYLRITKRTNIEHSELQCGVEISRGRVQTLRARSGKVVSFLNRRGVAAPRLKCSSGFNVRTSRVGYSVAKLPTRARSHVSTFTLGISLHRIEVTIVT